jgi:hypothetical protein
MRHFFLEGKVFYAMIGNPSVITGHVIGCFHLYEA